MKSHRIRHLPDHAVQCLTCACANVENFAARTLLQLTDALTSCGVLAAVFMGDSPEHERIVGAARRAIEEQRAWCHDHGAFRPDRCWRHIRDSNASTSSK